MIGIIVAVIVTALIIILKNKSLKKENSNVMETAFPLVAVFIGVAAFLLVNIMGLTGVTETTEKVSIVAEEQLEIINEGDSSHPEGYYIASDEFGFVYYTETENGFSRKYLKEEFENQPIYFQYPVADDETPHIERYGVVTKETLIEKPNIWFDLFEYIKFKDYNVGDVVSESVRYEPCNSEEDKDNYMVVVCVPEGFVQTPEGFLQTNDDNIRVEVN